jgi:hypothetical protein
MLLLLIAVTTYTADANLIWARWDPFEANQKTERMQKAHEQLKRLTIHQLVNQVCDWMQQQLLPKSR